MNGRSLIGVLTSALLLLAQLHIWGASGCSMCGASLGSVSPLRAVLVASLQFAPQFEFDRALTLASHPPPHPALPPLDRPPRVSC